MAARAARMALEQRYPPLRYKHLKRGVTRLLGHSGWSSAGAKKNPHGGCSPFRGIAAISRGDSICLSGAVGIWVALQQSPLGQSLHPTA